MLSFDSMKLEAPLLPCAGSFNQNHERLELYSMQKQGCNTEKYRINCDGITGLKNIEIKPEKDSIILELSGKILGKKYPLLINKDTILEALEAVNQNGCIIIRPEKLLKDAVIHSIDCTKDIYLDGLYTVREVLEVLSVMNHRSYKLVEYPEEGVFITKIARSNNKLLKFYDKGKELQRKENADIRELIDPEAFQHSLRSELCIRKHSFLRADFGVNHTGSVYLHEALEAKTNPTHKFWTDFLNPVPSLFEEYDESLPLSDVVKLEGIKGIIRACSYDERIILHFISLHLKGKENAYRTLKSQFRPVIDQMKNKINSKYNEIQSFITSQLLVN